MVKIQFEGTRKEAATLMKLAEALNICNQALLCNEKCKFYHLKEQNEGVCPIVSIKVQLNNLLDD